MSAIISLFEGNFFSPKKKRYKFTDWGRAGGDRLKKTMVSKENSNQVFMELIIKTLYKTSQRRQFSFHHSQLVRR
jgi:hypothetical protein